MIQTKVTMIGAFAVGKTSLVRRFVHRLFSERYHTTVGVRVDKKTLTVDGHDLMMIVWDIAGWDDFQEIRPSYLRGSLGLLLVVDGTRRRTLEDATHIVRLARDTVGDIPAVVVVNKADLAGDWEMDDEAVVAVLGRDIPIARTSAKTGDGVEEAFTILARRILAQ